MVPSWPNKGWAKTLYRAGVQPSSANLCWKRWCIRVSGGGGREATWSVGYLVEPEHGARAAGL